MTKCYHCEEKDRSARNGCNFPQYRDYSDNIPLQDQISSVLRVAEKTVVVMVKYDDSLHDDQPHHYKSTVLDMNIQDFAEVDSIKAHTLKSLLLTTYLPLHQHVHVP